MEEKTYIAIDLKSFYASVECVERGLDPMSTHLVVADRSRTEKTICLAVSPSLKALGIPGRARLFEVVQAVEQINARRRADAPNRQLTGSSWNAQRLRDSPALALDYIAAPPRMALYIEYSTRIYQVYLNYVAPEDIHVYSIDEVFLDATPYLAALGISPRELARRIILDVLRSTGIPAAAGIGTNLYLAKVAMDIVAKHIPADADGVRIAQLDEQDYRRTLWSHRPLTDFWRVGRGYVKKLEAHGLFTMGDIARCSVGKPGSYHSEALLYRLFGVNAELLIDHAWGREPCTLADIKAYRPACRSLGSGQVLQRAYTAREAKLVLKEMADQLALDLVEKGLVADRLVLTVGYDRESLAGPGGAAYTGPVVTDHYGRTVPKHAHGSAELGGYTDSFSAVLQTAVRLYDRIVDSALLVRRLNIAAAHILPKDAPQTRPGFEQLSLFADGEQSSKLAAAREREARKQLAVLSLKKKFGKNAVLRGMDLEECATARERNNQIGGHKA